MADSDDKRTQGEPTPEGSDEASNQTGGSQPAYVTVDEFQKLTESFESLRRSQQSEKDKGVKKANQRLDALEGDLRTVLQQAQSSGKSVQDLIEDYDAQEQAEFRSLMREMAQGFREGRFPQGTGTAEKGVDVSEVLSELELDTADTRVQAFRAKQFGSKEEAYREGAKLLKQITQSKRPSDADGPSDVARRQNAQGKQDALMQEYREGSKDLRGQALIRFKAEMRKKGLEIS